MKLGSIQFLRAVAALLVVYFHSIDFQRKLAHSFQQDFLHWANFGAIGVDIFFVISGFIISYSAGSYKGGREGVIFLVRRFKRVNFIYYLATLVMVGVLIHAVLMMGVPLITFPIILKSIFLLPLLDHTEFVPHILRQAWTLSFEWFFYLLFSLAIFTRTRSKERFLVLLIMALVVTGFLFNGFKGSDYRLIFMTNPILLEFLLGVCLYWCYVNVRVSKKMTFVLLAAGGCICLYRIVHGFGKIWLSEDTEDGSLSFVRFIRWGIPAGLLVAGCIFLEKAGSLHSIWNNPLTTYLGNASYSIYLTHMTIYLLCSSVYRRTGYYPNPDLAIWLQALLAITGGIIFYQLGELPLLRFLQRKRPRPNLAGKTQ